MADSNAIGVGSWDIERGDAADFAEDVLCGVSAEGVGSEELLGFPQELKIAGRDNEVSVAPHGAVRAVAPPSDHTPRGFHFPSHSPAVAPSLVHRSLRLRSHSPDCCR